MQTALTLTVLALLLPDPAALLPHGQDATRDGRVAQIDRILSGYHEHGQFDGAALVAIHGEVVYRRGFGLADRDRQQPITPDTRFAIASLGKAFSAFLILQLVDEEVLPERLARVQPEPLQELGRRVRVFAACRGPRAASSARGAHDPSRGRPRARTVRRVNGRAPPLTRPMSLLRPASSSPAPLRHPM